MDYLIQSLSLIAAALQVPVVIAILYLLVRGALATGMFFSQWADRSRRLTSNESHSGADAFALLSQMTSDALRSGKKNSPLLSAAAALQSAPHDPARRERILVEFELSCEKKLAFYRTMTRLGPLLGLMGTLIPLGPALVGLAQGDISLLARKMEVAFATTVVGLVIGAIGFLLYQTANRWAADDISLLEYFSRQIGDKN